MNSQFSQIEFENPGYEHAAAYAWVWNDVITEEGIVSRLQDMKKAGIGAIYVLPEPKEFRPRTMPTNMEPAYLSDEFMMRIRFLADQAREMGFGVWLYDEGGWPSGSACAQVIERRPDLRRKCIYPISMKLIRGMIYTPPVHHENFLASFQVDKDGNWSRILESLTVDEEITVTEYRCMAPTLLYADNEAFYSDILHPDTTRLFLELTHERYKKALEEHFGVFIPYMFNDEAGVDHHAWTPGLEQMFEQEYGYDILDYLPVLAEHKEIANAQEKKALCDWRRLVCKIAVSNYFLPIRDWCRENGIMSVGHLYGDHDAQDMIQGLPCTAMPMEVLRCYDVPGVDMIWRHIYPEGMGAPYFQKALPIMPRFASSAASQIGIGLALTESLSIYGEGLTPSIIRYVFGAQAVRGINVFNINYLSYGKDKIRPEYWPEKPGYESLTAVNAFLKRLSYLAKLGVAECSTALYLPCIDIAGGDSANAFHILGEALEKHNVYFDVIDDAFIRDAVIKEENKERALCMGLASYSYVFIPDGATLPEDVEAKLAGFIADHDVKRDMSLEEALIALQNNQRVLPVVRCKNDKLRFMKKNLENGNSLYFVFNESKDVQNAELVFPESRNGCYRLCLEDGRIETWENTKITLAMGDTAVFLFTQESLQAQSPKSVTAQIPLTEAYTLTKAREFVINRQGYETLEYCQDRECPENAAENIPVSLGAWKAYLTDIFSGEAIYRTTFRMDPAVLSENGEWILDLGAVEYTASVKINNIPIGVAAFLPHQIRFNGSVLQKENVLEIKVANTASNQIINADVYSYFALPVIGPYHQRMTDMERESLGGGLYGPVVLKKLG